MATGEIAPRLRQAPTQSVLGREVVVARGPILRTLGLALLDRAQAGQGLLIPRCRSVHTFGMRFALDLYFLHADGAPSSTRLEVPPWRVVSDRRAAAVLELPAGGRLPDARGEEFVAPRP
jgi:uncharacterized membrane protein (UPF0127 family)